jgi:hypothetical protein
MTHNPLPQESRKLYLSKTKMLSYIVCCNTVSRN